MAKIARLRLDTATKKKRKKPWRLLTLCFRELPVIGLACRLCDFNAFPSIPNSCFAAIWVHSKAWVQSQQLHMVLVFSEAW